MLNDADNCVLRWYVNNKPNEKQRVASQDDKQRLKAEIDKGFASGVSARTIDDILQAKRQQYKKQHKQQP